MLYLDLFSASVSKMCPNVIASLLSASAKFYRNVLLLDIRESCIQDPESADCGTEKSSDM